MSNKIDETDAALASFQRALVERAIEHAATVMPGFTHLQTAQPVTFGHHLLAYVEMAARDRGRFADARKRLNESPLGAAALAGTSFPIDRDATAKALGFDRPMANSLDAVSDRDFVLETLSAAAIAAVHLSRFADWMVRTRKMPFRDAHHMTGRIVAGAAKKGVPRHQLPLKDMQAVEPKITAEVLDVLSVEASVKSRNSYGGTAPKNVLAQAKGWLKRLEKERKLG